MDSYARRPIPGHWKMASVTIAPVKSVPNDSPRSVTIGKSALRSACFIATAVSDKSSRGARKYVVGLQNVEKLPQMRQACVVRRGRESENHRGQNRMVDVVPESEPVPAHREEHDVAREVVR